MPNVTYSCPNCQATVRGEIKSHANELTCDRCQQTIQPVDDAVMDSGIHRCLICSSSDLFLRKDFPQRLGVLIVVLGFGASCVTWYFHRIVSTFGILFATALVDVLLYLFMGELVECYRCHAQYRDVVNLKRHEPFRLETHEKYRQQAARVARSS